MFVYGFEKLKVWQLSRQFAVAIYEITKKFPVKEKFGLINQMRRAAISVASNIAEGSSKTSPKEQGHFTEIAFSSLMELLNQIIISRDLHYITDSDYQILRSTLEEIGNKLNALKNSQIMRFKRKK